MASSPTASALERTGRALIAIGAFPGRVAAWLVLPLLGLVVATVIGSLMRLNEVAAWQGEVLLLGDRLNLTGLAELQWHLFAVMVMLGGAYALAENRHVNVDLLSARFPPRLNAAVRLVGDLALLMPFCVMVGLYSVDFAEFAWRTDERSDYGGLTDRWLVKAVLPLGLGLLALVGLGRILVSLAVLLAPRRAPDG